MRFERISPAHRVLGVIVAGLGITILSNQPDSTTSLAWGVGLAVLGAIVATARGGTVLDFARKEVVTYLGLVVPWGRQRRPFSSLRRVRVHGRRRGQNTLGARYEFPVELHGDGPDVRLVEPRDYAQARRLARTLAHKMGLALTDHGDARDPGFVDEPLRDRLLRTGAVPGREKLDASDPYRVVTATREAPPPPAGTRITVEDGETATTLRIPRRFHLSWGLLLVPLGGLLGAAPLYATDASPAAVLWAAVAWLPSTMILVLYLSELMGKACIVVHGGGVRIHQPGVFGRRFDFPITDLDDIHVASAVEPRYANLTSRADYPAAWPFVVVRSDRRAVPVAVGYAPEELSFLVARLLHAVFVHSTGARARR